MSLVHSILPFAIFRLLLGAAQGAFTAAPYILMREINESKDVPKAMGYLASAIAVGSFGGGILLGGACRCRFFKICLDGSGDSAFNWGCINSEFSAKN